MLKADRNVLRRLITSCEVVWPVNLPFVLKNEILPAPLSIAEMNGTLRTGNKSALANVITERINCHEAIERHETSSCLMIDRQALVVALGKTDNSSTFGHLVDTYVSIVLKAGSEYQRIDVVFDMYREETIKCATRTRRSKTTRSIRRLIEGRDVPLPSNLKNYLSFADNKAFLAPKKKEIVVTGGFMEELEVRSSKGRTDVNALRSIHEEADARLVLHAVHSQFKTVVVSSRDTDVCLLLVSHYPLAKCEKL